MLFHSVFRSFVFKMMLMLTLILILMTSLQILVYIVTYNPWEEDGRRFCQKFGDKELHLYKTIFGGL